MIFRQANVQDIPFLLEGFRSTHHGLEHARIDDYEQRLHQDIFTKNPKAYIYIFEKDNQRIGYVLYAFCYFASMGSVLWMSQLYIAPPHRGKYLRTIVSTLKNHAKEIDAHRLIWCSDIKEERLPNLWTRGGGKALNPEYTFWSINPNK